MLFRFSLYGFLKNQVYFEPFLILVFLEKGLDFFQIGLLIGFREILINIFEVPSGAIADLYGRRRSMIFSFSAYILSFLVFSYADSLLTLFGAMFAFSLGESFRSGTHKAMIFDWLRLNGREGERARVYGFTRSWSKIGSALSVVVAAAFVFSGARYSDIFLLTTVPYILGIVNFLGYPANLDGPKRRGPFWSNIASHLGESLQKIAKTSSFRGIFAESMVFEGSYKVSKDYIQPILKQTALGLSLFALWQDQQRVAVLVGFVYFFLHILSSVASRSGYLLSRVAGSDEEAARLIWRGTVATYGILGIVIWMGWEGIGIAAFIALSVIQNIWRPLMMSRIDAQGSPEAGATILSVESQAKSLVAMVLAPLIGLAVDQWGLFSVGAIACLITLPFAASGIFGKKYASEKAVQHP